MAILIQIYIMAAFINMLDLRKLYIIRLLYLFKGLLGLSFTTNLYVVIQYSFRLLQYAYIVYWLLWLKLVYPAIKLQPNGYVVVYLFINIDSLLSFLSFFYISSKLLEAYRLITIVLGLLSYTTFYLRTNLIQSSNVIRARYCGLRREQLYIV